MKIRISINRSRKRNSENFLNSCSELDGLFIDGSHNFPNKKAQLTI